MISNYQSLSYMIRSIKQVFIYMFIFVFLAQNIAFCGEESKEPLSLRVGAPSYEKSKTLMEVAFFNVGQGNCTVVRAPNKKDIFIIDAGSNRVPLNVTHKREEEVALESIVEAIEKWISSSSQKMYDIRFIVSHSDNDHKNYVLPLLRTFKTRTDSENPQYTYRCFYYNHPDSDNFGENKKEEDKILKFNKDNQDLRSYLGKFDLDSINKENLKEKLDFSINYLNDTFMAGKGIGNDQSLVLFLQFGMHGILLTGDATDKTFNIPSKRVGGKPKPGVDWSILDTFRKENKNNNIIFQASHHGALSEGSNSLELINIIKPNITVFSAPRYSHYRHPKYQIVERIIRSENSILPLENKLYHFFFLDKTINSTEVDGEENKLNRGTAGMFEAKVVYRDYEAKKARRDGLYALYSTNYPIFHTGSHGTLIFTLTKDSMFVDTYDYMNKIHQASTRPSRQRQKQQKIEYVGLEKTTSRVFQGLDERDRLIGALKSEGAVIGYCPPISSDLYLERYEIIRLTKVELIKLQLLGSDPAILDPILEYLSGNIISKLVTLSQSSSSSSSSSNSSSSSSSSS